MIKNSFLFFCSLCDGKSRRNEQQRARSCFDKGSVTIVQTTFVRKGRRTLSLPIYLTPTFRDHLHKRLNTCVFGRQCNANGTACYLNFRWL